MTKRTAELAQLKQNPPPKKLSKRRAYLIEQEPFLEELFDDLKAKLATVGPVKLKEGKHDFEEFTEFVYDVFVTDDGAIADDESCSEDDCDDLCSEDEELETEEDEDEEETEEESDAPTHDSSDDSETGDYEESESSATSAQVE